MDKRENKKTRKVFTALLRALAEILIAVIANIAAFALIRLMGL